MEVNTWLHPRLNKVLVIYSFQCIIRVFKQVLQFVLLSLNSGVRAVSIHAIPAPTLLVSSRGPILILSEKSSSFQFC